MQTDDGKLPAGMLAPFAGSAAPTGWLLCFGQAVSRTTYAALFAAIGTTYGAGDGSTTFLLPDLRGRVVAGLDNMGGTSANRLVETGNGSPGINGDTLGAAGGSDRHQLTAAQMPLHGHPTQVSSNTGSSSTPTGGMMLTTNSSASRVAYTGPAGNTVGEQVGGAGGDQAHPNVQPTIVLTYIIKT